MGRVWVLVWVWVLVSVLGLGVVPDSVDQLPFDTFMKVRGGARVRFRVRISALDTFMHVRQVVGTGAKRVCGWCIDLCR